MAIAGKLVRKAAHVASALDVILPAQRIHADTAPPDVAGCHCEVSDCHNSRAALRMLGNAQTVIDRAVAAVCIKPRRFAQFVSIDQRDRLQIFGAVARMRNKFGPMAIFVPVAAFADKRFVCQALSHDHMRHRG